MQLRPVAGGLQRGPRRRVRHDPCQPREQANVLPREFGRAEERKHERAWRMADAELDRRIETGDDDQRALDASVDGVRKGDPLRGRGAQFSLALEEELRESCRVDPTQSHRRALGNRHEQCVRSRNARAVENQARMKKRLQSHSRSVRALTRSGTEHRGGQTGGPSRRSVQSPQGVSSPVTMLPIREGCGHSGKGVATRGGRGGATGKVWPRGAGKVWPRGAGEREERKRCGRAGMQCGHAGMHAGRDSRPNGVVAAGQVAASPRVTIIAASRRNRSQALTLRSPPSKLLANIVKKGTNA